MKRVAWATRFQHCTLERFLAVIANVTLLTIDYVISLIRLSAELPYKKVQLCHGVFLNLLQILFRSLTPCLAQTSLKEVGHCRHLNPDRFRGWHGVLHYELFATRIPSVFANERYMTPRIEITLEA